MKKLLFTIFILFINLSNIYSQTISSFTNQWYNTYSNGVTANGIGVFARGITDNGNLIVSGSSWPTWPSGTTNQLVTKISSNGSALFQTLRSPGTDHDGFGAVTILDNGNYAFFGQQNAQGTQYFDAFYCVFNQNLVEQSSNFFSVPGSSSGSDMKKLPNGNLVFTGNHGNGNNFIALTNQNFNQIQYLNFNVSNNGWNHGSLALDTTNNYIYAIGGEENTNIVQIKRYDFNLNLLNTFTINETNPFKVYDVIVVNGNLWLCGYKVISNNRYASLIKLDINGNIADTNTLNTTSEYTAIVNYSNEIILAKSNLNGTTSSSNQLITYLGNNNFGTMVSLNSGSPFVPFDLVIDQNFIFCIGVQGQNHYVGIPAVQKLKIENIPYSENCNSVSGSLVNGLVGYWPFCGNAYDQSGNSNNGVVNGASLTTDRFGNTNSAYNFNGTSNKINFGTSQSLINLSQFTYSVWINRSVNCGNDAIVISNYGGNWAGNLLFGKVINNGDAQIRLHKQNLSINSSSSISDNQWINLVAVKDNNTLKLYKNGLLIQTTDISNFGSVNNMSFPFVIGGAGWSDSNYFMGKIDDVGVWNRALTPQEISQLYNQNQCINNLTVTDTLIINVGQLSFENPIIYANNITIFPNPASTQININFNNISDLNGGTIKIINSLGQEVATTTITATGTNSTMSLNAWGGNGLYFVQILNPQGQIVDIKKIILQ
jgi:hypothetical protein